MSSTPVNLAYTRSLPKIELHAHLTGSITPQTLHEIWLHHNPTLDTSTTPLEDPLHALSSDKKWDIRTFFPLFSSYIYALVCTKESVIYATNAVLNDFLEDGVVYLELRTTPRASVYMSKEAYVDTVLECIAAFPSGGRMAMFLVLSIDRGMTAEEAMAVVELALRYRHRGVVGVDLCGDPRKGDVGVFGDAFERAGGEGLGVTLHFGEIEAAGGREVDVLLGWRPGRVGHVVCVGGEVREEVLRRGVGVELCVSCNVLAGLTEGGVGGHHFGWWWGRGGRIVLCTDDVGVFGSTLSNEYLLVAEHFDLSRRDLLDLCGRGVETIFGGEGEKLRLRALIKEKEEGWFGT